MNRVYLCNLRPGHINLDGIRKQTFTYNIIIAMHHHRRGGRLQRQQKSRLMKFLLLPMVLFQQHERKPKLISLVLNPILHVKNKKPQCDSNLVATHVLSYSFPLA